MDEQNEEVQEFWKNTEEEIGEKVLDKALARCISGCNEKNPTLEVWGLIYYTETTIFFKHFTQSNWLLNIIRMNKKKGGDKEFLLRIPRDAVTELVFVDFQNLWQRMFSKDLPHLYLKYNDAVRGEVELRLMVEKRKEEISDFLTNLGVEK